MDTPELVQTFFKSAQPSRVERAQEKARLIDAVWRACCKLVDARDHRRCRCCGRRSDPEAIGLLVRGHRHHIIYRSAGGENSPENVITLCAECHDDEHVKRTLRVEGNADEGVMF